MRELTINEALRKKNIIDRQLEGADSILRNQVFIETKKIGLNKTTKNRTREEAEKVIQGSFDKVEALVEERFKLDRAIKLSNAKVEVKIAGIRYTIAEAIEYKKSHKLKVNILKEMKRQFSAAMSDFEYANNEAEDRINEQKVALFGSEAVKSGNIEKQLEAIRKSEDLSRVEIIDPKKLGEFIETETEEIENFLLEVNDVINTSNAVTKIEIK